MTYPTFNVYLHDDGIHLPSMYACKVVGALKRLLICCTRAYSLLKAIGFFLSFAGPRLRSFTIESHRNRSRSARKKRDSTTRLPVSSRRDVLLGARRRLRSQKENDRGAVGLHPRRPGQLGHVHDVRPFRSGRRRRRRQRVARVRRLDHSVHVFARLDAADVAGRQPEPADQRGAEARHPAEAEERDDGEERGELADPVRRRGGGHRFDRLRRVVTGWRRPGEETAERRRVDARRRRRRRR